MKRLAYLLALALAGCQSNANVVTGPKLTPVGDGLAYARAPLPVGFSEPPRRSPRSLVGENSADLFRDQRARRVGDVVTVVIAIDDKAQFDNESGRSRESQSRLGLGGNFSFGGFGAENQSGSTAGGLDATSGTRSRGAGSIDRSEKLRLSVAAVVTEVLPNGNLLISGTQEVKVNFELRVLNIAGIVRPLDISGDNVISYEKIAEARVSYGGRGRITEVQQPAWGQRIYDSVTPF